MSEIEIVDPVVSESEGEEVNEIMNNEGPVETESTSEVTVEPAEEEPEEPAPSEAAPVEEAAPVASEVEEPVEEAAEQEAAEEAAEEAVPVAHEEEEPKPVERVVSDIRDILSEDPVVTSESSNSSELTINLKQRIAELDYLRECCGNWLWYVVEEDKINFIKLLKNKNVSIDSNVNYEDILKQLEKLPEIVKFWIEKGMNKSPNYFKEIISFNSENHLFSEKNVIDKIEELEQLVKLMTDYAEGRMNNKSILDLIGNLYQ